MVLGGRSLDVLVAGSSLPPNPGELIESRAMESLLEQAKAKYDLVVIDTPPLTAVSDAFPLLGKVDGVIIVGRVGRNRRAVAQRLHETLMGAGAPSRLPAPNPLQLVPLVCGAGRPAPASLGSR
jgi:Mrp family chromosome partitioning ATPase